MCKSFIKEINPLKKNRAILLFIVINFICIGFISAKSANAGGKRAYPVQVASFDAEESARKRVEELEDMGWPAGIYSSKGSKGKIWYVVHIGIYNNRKDALLIAERYTDENKEEIAFQKSYDHEIMKKRSITPFVVTSISLKAAPATPLPAAEKQDEKPSLSEIKEEQDEKPPLPEIKEDQDEKPSLPEITVDSNRIFTVGKILVQQFDFKGNTVFSSDELNSVIGSYLNREISSEELHEAKKMITEHYIENGYINSGTVIPDQNVGDGVITLKIIEGRLIKIEITGNSKLRNNYIKSRLSLATGKGKIAFNIKVLQDRLKLIKQDPLIENINADIKPGVKQGEAILDVELKEAARYRAGITFDNYRSPSINSWGGKVYAETINLTGWGDSLRVGSGRSGWDEGSEEYSFGYTVPFTRWDSTLSTGYSRTTSTVVTEPFDRLDIESETKTIFFFF